MSSENFAKRFATITAARQLLNNYRKGAMPASNEMLAKVVQSRIDDCNECYALIDRGIFRLVAFHTYEKRTYVDVVEYDTLAGRTIFCVQFAHGQAT